MTDSFGTLYKYRSYSARSLELLIKREVYFASPEELNDPYDCRLDIKESLRVAVDRATRLGNKDLATKLARLRKIDHVYEKMNNDLAGIGVFSLSHVPDSILMWTHYSANHSGFCVGFRLSKTFTSHRNLYHIIGAADVRYASSNPFVDFFEEMARAEKPPEWDIFWQGLLLTGMVTKAECWDYEEEVRILRKGTGPVPFEATELVEIVFGLNMPLRDRTTLRMILSGPDWAHVRFKEVVRSDGFALDVRDASAI